MTSANVRTLRLMAAAEHVADVLYELEGSIPGLVLREGQLYAHNELATVPGVRVYELEPVYVDGAGYIARVYEPDDLEALESAAMLDNAEQLGIAVATSNAVRVVEREASELELLEVACSVFAKDMGAARYGEGLGLKLADHKLTEHETEALRGVVRCVRWELARVIARRAMRPGQPKLPINLAELEACALELLELVARAAMALRPTEEKPAHPAHADLVKAIRKYTVAT